MKSNSEFGFPKIILKKDFPGTYFIRLRRVGALGLWRIAQLHPSAGVFWDRRLRQLEQQFPNLAARGIVVVPPF